ncbi:hypothetical protein FKP32DRAFT_1591350 [Trametes sanguinea]|nr:hypothetical protein FKP32DRAFT_1591350 [Trametes sanguinea]
MHELVGKLGDLLNHPPVSVELLPGDGSEWFTEDSPQEIIQHAPFLFVEGNLGVPHKLAYKLYLQSVPTFQECRARLRSQPTGETPLDLDGGLRTLTHHTLASSAVLLLVNPAHQSALNARKRLVQLGALEAAHELRFVSALFTLRDGAKQSILWHHRRWLLRRVYSSLPPPARDEPRTTAADLRGPQGDGADSLAGLSLDADWFRTEFGVVSRACEIYPRNYHAWAHRFLCAQALATLCTHPATSDARRAGWREALREEAARAREWVDRHVSDYSAMQYACRVQSLQNTLRAAADVGSRGSRPVAEEGSVDAPLVEHAWSLVKAYPAHESLWLYFRGAMNIPSSDEALALADLPAVRGISTRAEEFAERLLSDVTGPEGTSSVLPADGALARNHAVRFLAWVLWKEKKIRLGERFFRRVALAAESPGKRITRVDLLDDTADRP